ncbi:unnamed protein product [Didymodactylos carnosus]|uniref:NHL repeat-containing protein n=1 Tax=Didymodactylos carnosus TaxID=1234261 RepID=A0A813VF69_9BILA|nr:unnamed protein product [Didymodactylos carnosus]CAF0836619.1 unnamed protein product [Didymodactylos carnosus]CAF3609215.1 unnamed protein product [Didymodactylos carnosus]CAF3623837.1 unnamed protein product [Didymodactylos carnosus]
MHPNPKVGIVFAGQTGVSGGKADQLWYPEGVFIDESDANGPLYICDSNNQRIQKWLQGAASGTTVADGGRAEGLTTFTYPKDIILDRIGNQMYIAESNHQRIVR